MLRDANPKAFSGIYLYDSDVIHADETPFQVVRDNRSPGSKSYMWVYRNGACGDRKPVVLYDYQPTRKTDHPEEFLKDYNGTLSLSRLRWVSVSSLFRNSSTLCFAIVSFFISSRIWRYSA